MEFQVLNDKIKIARAKNFAAAKAKNWNGEQSGYGDIEVGEYSICF